MNEDKICRYLGLARRAGKLVCGFEAVARQIAAGEKMVIVVATDISPKSLKELTLLTSQNNKVEVVHHATKTIIGNAIGRNDTGIVGCIDAGIAKQLIAQTKGN